jgi:hypothetical protein
LLDYFKEVESGSTQWTSAQGVFNDWFPQPTWPDMKTIDSTSIIDQDAYPAPIPEDGTKGGESSRPAEEVLPYP